MTGEQNAAEEQQTVHHGQPAAHHRPSVERDEDAAAYDRTSPFPYAEDFDEWVADETATPDGRRPRSAAGDTDS